MVQRVKVMVRVKAGSSRRVLVHLRDTKKKRTMGQLGLEGACDLGGRVGWPWVVLGVACEQQRGGGV
jgi:hypothetical protein